MNEGLLMMAEGYEQLAAGIRKMLAEKSEPRKEERPVAEKNEQKQVKEEKKAVKAEAKTESKTESEAVAKGEKVKITMTTVRAFLMKKSESGKTSEVKNLLLQFGCAKLSDVPTDKLPELYAKAQEVL